MNSIIWAICHLGDNIVLVVVVEGSLQPKVLMFLDCECYFFISITVSVEEIDKEIVLVLGISIRFIVNEVFALASDCALLALSSFWNFKVFCE